MAHRASGLDYRADKVAWPYPRRGGNRAGQFMHLMPAFGTILSMIFLGEQPALYHLAGIALILAGIFLTTRVRT